MIRGPKCQVKNNENKEQILNLVFYERAMFNYLMYNKGGEYELQFPDFIISMAVLETLSVHLEKPLLWGTILEDVKLLLSYVHE